MTRNIRAVIMRPEHTNDIFIVKAKMWTNEKMFKRGNSAYMIDDDHFQLTHDRPWWMLWLIKRTFTTYYYALNKPNPLPVPNFGTTAAAGVVDGEELASMFEPWLWRVIAGPTRDAWEQLQFYMQVGTLLGVAYLVWTTYQSANTGA